MSSTEHLVLGRQSRLLGPWDTFPRNPFPSPRHAQAWDRCLPHKPHPSFALLLPRAVEDGIRRGLPEPHWTVGRRDLDVGFLCQSPYKRGEYTCLATLSHDLKLYVQLFCQSPNPCFPHKHLNPWPVQSRPSRPSLSPVYQLHSARVLGLSKADLLGHPYHLYISFTLPEWYSILVTELLFCIV